MHDVARKLAHLSAAELGKVLPATAFPFKDIPLDCLHDFVGLVIATPEAQGPLSRAVRSLLNIRETLLENYTVIEVHVDLSERDSNLSCQLLSWGFEPDDFFLLHPECYKRHFTSKYVIGHADASRRRALHRKAEQAAQAAVRYVQAHPILYGYIEVETYPSSNIYKGSAAEEVGPTWLNGLSAMLIPYGFKQSEISTSTTHPGANELCTTTVKKADLHIKVPASLDNVDQGLTSEIRGILTQNGFYEIVSEAGNSIYTCQFLDVALTKELFSRTSALVQGAGIPITVTWEPCHMFWRKRMSFDDDVHLAPVPPIVQPA